MKKEKEKARNEREEEEEEEEEEKRTARRRRMCTAATFSDSNCDILDDLCVIDDRDLLLLSRNSETGLHVLDLIDSCSLEPNQSMYNVMLKRCTQLGKLREERLVHSHILNSKLKDDLVIRNSVLFIHARCGSLEEARRVFDEMPSKDMVTWTSMITGCGYLSEARLAFDKLENKNEVSWNALIPGYARKRELEDALALFIRMQREGSLEQGKWLHAPTIKWGKKLAGYVGNTLLHMYAKSGSIQDARKVLNRLLKIDVVSFSSMLIGYAQHGFGKEAVQQFEKMLRIGIEPNDITFLSVLTACSRAGLLDEGKHYFGLMKKYNIESKISHYVTIVDLFGRAGLIYQARSFIEEMAIEPTAAIWELCLGHKYYLPIYMPLRVGGRWLEEGACMVEIQNFVHVFVANDFANPHNEKVLNMWEKLNHEIKVIGYVPDTSYVLLCVDQ
ncbi:Pentatricopeptide repeat-containing protein [Arachis hypogaea]|nr:Pentatricopeptide repeat-containing protein [Arachis hypogaea]